MDTQSESAESLGGLVQENDLRVTRPSLVEEYVGPAARFGENYLRGNFPKEDEDIVMTGSNPIVEAESDDDPAGMAAGQCAIREAIKMIRDRRRDGYDDKLRVQRKIGRRKAKPIRQRISKKEKYRAEESLEENRRGERKEHAGSSTQPVQEYITPSCVPGSYRVPLGIPGRAPPSPTLVGTPLAASTRALLAQLKEIESHPPTRLPGDGQAVISPVASPALLPKGEGEVKESWDREAIHGQYTGYNSRTGQQTQYLQTSPYEMRDHDCSPFGESPSP